MQTHSTPTTRILSLAAVMACVWQPGFSQAATWPSLTWDPNPETGVTDYKVYVGASSGVYSTILTVSGATRTVLPAVPMGSTMYIAVSAMNSSGLESAPSAELVVVADTPSPALSTSFTMNSPGQGQIQWKFPITGVVPADTFTVYASEDLVNWAPAAEVPINSPTSSDSKWLYFGFGYQAVKSRMFFKVGATNAFGETL